MSKNKASCRNRPAQEAEPATVLVERRRRDRRTNGPQGQNHRCRRAMATMWDVTECLRHGEMTCTGKDLYFGLLRLRENYRLTPPENATFPVHLRGASVSSTHPG